MGALNLRDQLGGLDSCARECAPIGQPGFETRLLSSSVRFEFLALFFSDCFERAIVKRRVKRQSRCV